MRKFKQFRAHLKRVFDERKLAKVAIEHANGIKWDVCDNDITVTSLYKKLPCGNFELIFSEENRNVS